jgi:hypothetical protein
MHILFEKRKKERLREHNIRSELVPSTLDASVKLSQ